MASPFLSADGTPPLGHKRSRRSRRLVVALAVAFVVAGGAAHGALADDGVQLTISPNPAAPGQSVSMTATVTSPDEAGQPTGTIQFVNMDTGEILNDPPNGDDLAPPDVNDDGTTTTYTFTTTTMSVGTWHIQAQYTADFAAGVLFGIANMVSDTQTLTIGSALPTKSPTATTLTAPASVTVGAPVTLTATVARTDGSTGIPTGTVEFDDVTGTSPVVLGTTPVNGTGTATLSVSSLSQGPHTIKAGYSGDSQDQMSTSAAVGVSSDPGADPRLTTTTAVSVSPTTTASGDIVTIIATVTQVGHAIQPPGNNALFISNSSCGGNVTLGTAVMGTGPPGVTVAANQVAIQTPAFGPCTYTITVSYSGDVFDQPSSGTSPSPLSVLGARDSTSIAYSGDSSVTWNHTATFSATITGQSTPESGKSVTFTLGLQACTATSDANGFASCQLQATQTGNQTLTVTVPKDLTVSGRSSTFNVTINPQQTTLTTSYQLGVSGTTLNATLNAEGGPVANQPVTLSLGSNTCGPVTTNASGAASCTVPPVTGQDTTTFAASYAGNGQYTAASASTSIAVIFPTAIAYTGATTATYGGAVTLSGVLTQTNTNTPLSGRTVTFALGSQQCTGTTDANGLASCTVQPVTVAGGSSNVQASYAGDAVTKPSTKSASFTVTAAATSLSATAPTPGSSTTSLSAVLTSGGSPVVGRTLSLALGSNICTATTDATGTGTCSVTTPTGATTTFTAAFAGDNDYSSSGDSTTVVLPTTTLVYNGATTAPYNSSPTFSATLTRAGDGSAVSGKTIVFTFGTQTCQGTTSAIGVATCSIVITQTAGSKTSSASFAGDALARASSVSFPLAVTLAPTTVTAGTATAGLTTTTLSASLVSGGSPVAGKTLTLKLATATCSATTDATGTASCTVTTPIAPSATFTASFAGDSNYAASTNSKTVPLPTPVNLAYTGTSAVVYGGSAPLSAALTTSSGGSPVSGKTITFSIGSLQLCSATTDASGNAACTVPAITTAPGSYTVSAAFAGDSSTRPSSAFSPFAVSKAPTVTTPIAPTPGSSTTSLSATLKSSGNPVAGEAMSLSLGGSSTCTGTTDSTGTATCAVATPSGGTATFTASFAGDADYLASTASTPVVLPATALAYTGPANATFAAPFTPSAKLTRVGDGSAVTGATVTFTLGGQTCQGTTNTSGVASCTIAAVTSAPGSTSVSASYAGDAVTLASSTSSSFIVRRASSTTTAVAPTAGAAQTTLSATLASAGSPLAGKAMTLSLGGTTCTASTDATGTASCLVTTPSGGTATYTATFAGDVDYTASNDTKTVVLPATTLVYSGATTAAYNGSATLTALLTKTGDDSPLDGRLISFTLGSQSCQATTEATGVASCTIAAVTADSGTTTVTASFAGDGAATASSTSLPFVVSLAPTVTATGTPVVGVGSTTLSAALTANGIGLVGEAMTLTLGANSCTGTTDVTGTATCTVTTPTSDTATFTASFAGSADYAASSDSTNVALFAATTLSYTGATSATYNSPAILAATLTKTSDGTPLAGRTVTFTLGTETCPATTNAAGIATCPIGIVQAAGTHTLTVTYAGDATTKPSNDSAQFTITKAATITVAATPTPGASTTTLNATLTTGGSPLLGQAMTLTLGSNTCTGTTDATGTATCAVTTPTSDTATYTAAFAGSADYAASSDSTNVTLFAATTLTYTGATSATYNSPAILAATLTKTSDGTPLAGRTVTFTLGTETCPATTNAAGIATCPIGIVQAAGTHTLTVTYAGDATTKPSNDSAQFTITKAATVTVAATPTPGASTTTLNATLTTGGSPLLGQAMTLTLGSNTCTGTTDATGTATCAVTTPTSDTATYTASFAGSADYAASSDSTNVTLFAATTLTYTGATSATYNSPAILAATLTKTSDGTPLAGRTVTFTLGSQSCEAIAAANGTATCSITIAQGAGPATVDVTYPGDATTKPAATSASFTVNAAATVTTALAPTVGSPTTTLSATLASSGSPLVGEAMTLALGANICTGSTDATGTATCAVTTPSSDNATYTATFGGDADYAASNDSQSVLLVAPTTLHYTGDTSAVFNTAATLSASLTASNGGLPLAGRTVTFTLGSQTCQAMTDASGVASCSIAPITADAGSTTVTATYTGDALTKPATDAASFTISKAATLTVATLPTPGVTTTTLNATLTSGGSPLSGQAMTLALGPNSCTGTTDLNGVATCAVNTPTSDTASYTATFAGDTDYATSSDSKSVALFAATTLTYTGATTAGFNSPATFTATLTKSGDGTPLAGRIISFSVGSQNCQGTTSASGTASCALAAVTADAGSYTVSASYPGDATTKPADDSAAFTVSKASTVTVANTPTPGVTATTLSAKLTTAGGAPLSGEAMTLSLGPNSCNGTTDGTGTATCAVTTPSSDNATYTATFAGANDYAASSDSKNVALFAATTLHFTGATSAAYNDTATLAATLTKTGDGTPLAGRTVTFTIGSQSCEASTATGAASCTITIVQAAGSSRVDVAYAGDGTTQAGSTSSAFTINLASTTTVATAPVVGATTTPLSATLTSGSTPLAGKAMTLALGANSCTVTTDASGVASCSVNTPSGSNAQYVATFAGDTSYAASSDTKNVTLIAPTTLTYNGAATAVYNGAAALSATLTKTVDVTPLTGRAVTFTLGSQTCQGTTNAAGVATCSIANVTADSGSYTVTASYAGDTQTKPATDTATFHVTLAPTATAAATPTVGNTTTPLTATLTTGGTALANKPMTLALGANSCTATTNASGIASCSVNTPSGASVQYTATFAGDADYATSTDSRTVTLLAPSTLTYLGSFRGEYSDLAIFSALLTGPNYQLLSGQTVTFTVGTQSCNSITIFGVALCFMVINQPAGSYQVTTSYAGNSVYGPASTNAPFTVAPEEAVANAGTVTTTGTTSTLNATLTTDGSPLAGETMTLTLGSNSCTDTTDSNGVATCSVATPNSNSATFTATFAGDGYYVGSSDNETVTLPTLTTLTYTGPTSVAHGGTASLSAKLTRTGDGALSGRTIAFSLGSQQCSATTNSSGIASCAVANVSASAGATTVTANYAGDSSTRATTASSPFTVTVAPTTLTLGNPTVTSATTTLVATLTGGGSPLGNEPLTLTLGSNSCTATTNSNGSASCNVATPATDTATFTAAFAGDGGYGASTAGKSVALLASTGLTYNGATTATRNGSATLSATLTKTSGGSALSGRTIAFSLGSQQCSASTNSSGVASCTISSVSAAVGATTVTATYLGDSTTRAATVSSSFTVTAAPATLVADVNATVQSGTSTSLKGTLTSAGTPVAGRTLTLALGPANCTATTNSSGVGTCSVTASAPLGPATATASFAGDGSYAATSDTDPTVVYALSSGGTFAIGDRSTSGTVTFWSSQWSSANNLSKSSAQSSFKGFASSPTTPSCGGTWSTGSGNSPTPPSSLPGYMAVVVTNSMSKSGSTITGTIASVVVVKTSSGYDGNPGHAGTGTVVATVC